MAYGIRSFSNWTGPIPSGLATEVLTTGPHQEVLPPQPLELGYAITPQIQISPFL